MERDGDLILNVSCSHSQPGKSSRKLPARMPDGSKIDSNRNLTKKIFKTHEPATNSGTVFIPKHKLPVLDEFGLSKPLPKQNYKKPPQKRLAQREEEPKIIPKEVKEVAGGLPPSFPKHTLKKFTEEYQNKKRKRLEEGDDQNEAEKTKRRRSFVPGLNPRKREKTKNLFTDLTLHDLEDIHPYLISNMEQNFEIKNLTKIQSLAMPPLLKTRFSLDISEFLINSGIGSGKTLSYIVPIINNLALMEPKIDRTAGIYSLVLLPTRELAAKVNDIFVRLCRTFLWIVPGLLTGGERKKSEKARLRKGLNILITTPGRLIDHMEHSKSLSFSKMRYFVVADAHRLLDAERADVAKQIFIFLKKKLPRDCVKCVVTATVTKKLEKLYKIVLPNPKVVDSFKEFE